MPFLLSKHIHHSNPTYILYQYLSLTLAGIQYVNFMVFRCSCISFWGHRAFVLYGALFPYDLKGVVQIYRWFSDKCWVLDCEWGSCVFFNECIFCLCWVELIYRCIRTSWFTKSVKSSIFMLTFNLVVLSILKGDIKFSNYLLLNWLFLPSILSGFASCILGLCC